MRPHVIALAALVLLCAVPVSAQQPSLTNWPALNTTALPAVYVTDDNGVETAGRLLRIDPDSLVLLVNGTEHRFDAAHVTRIQKRGDSLRNGALIGGLIGVGLGVLAGGFADCPGSGSGGCAGARAGLVLISTGVYAAIGTAVDALRVGRTTLYVAPPKCAPAVQRRVALSLSPGSFGLAMRFRW